MKLLLDEMYPPSLAEALREAGVNAVTVAELGLAGRSDPDVFAAACDAGYILLTENVSDFARIAADHLSTGRRHPGVLIALSSRFSRRASGRGALVYAVLSIGGEQVEDRTIYLRRADRE